jgi:hypothetical protein
MVLEAFKLFIAAEAWGEFSQSSVYESWKLACKEQLTPVSVAQQVPTVQVCRALRSGSQASVSVAPVFLGMRGRTSAAKRPEALR